MGTYPGFHFCLCHNTALGAALLITALKKKNKKQFLMEKQLFWLVGKKFAFSVSVEDGE